MPKIEEEFIHISTTRMYRKLILATGLLFSVLVRVDTSYSTTIACPDALPKNAAVYNGHILHSMVTTASLPTTLIVKGF